MENKKTNEWKEREVGALWRRKGANTSYCTGYIVYDDLGKKVQQRVVMFSNKNKTKDTAPDFILYLSKENDNPKGEAAPAAKPKTVAKAASKSPQPANADQEDDDGIPM